MMTKSVIWSFFLALTSLSAHAHKFVIFTSPTLGNFRDLSGIIGGLINFRHDVYLVIRKQNRTIREFAEFQTLKYIEFDVEEEKTFDERQRWKYIYENNNSGLKLLEKELIEQECKEILQNENKILEKIQGGGVHISIVDASFPCYYSMAAKIGIPYASLISRSEPWLLQTHPLMMNPCYLQYQNTIYTRLEAFLTYMTNWDTALARGSALWLWNTNGIVDCQGVTTSNLLQVGSLSHQEEQSLPESVDELANNSQYGIVVFSLPGIEVSDQYIEKFLEVFEQIDQTVIWRVSLDTSEHHLPQNVLTTSLIPEKDLLAHVNVKLMITDGDNARQLDAIFHGVPIISVPLTPEQNYNADRLQFKGHGKKLSLDFTANELVDMISDVINDDIITETTRNSSSILKGSPDYRYIAVYWLDLIARYGAGHLKPVQLSRWQFLLIDIFLIITGISCLLCALIAALMKVVVNAFSSHSKFDILEEGVRKPQSLKPQTKVPTKVDLSHKSKSKATVEEVKPTETTKKFVMKSDIPLAEKPKDMDQNADKLQHQGSKKNKKKKNK